MNLVFKDQIILENIILANSFWSRLSGYMFRKNPHVSGILFVTSSSMQTTFMRFNLDIVFLDKSNRIVKVLRNVKPWRFTKFYKNTFKVLELPAGTIPTEIEEGEVVSFS